jgi:hypothetical protein
MDKIFDDCLVFLLQMSHLVFFGFLEPFPWSTSRCRFLEYCLLLFTSSFSLLGGVDSWERTRDFGKALLLDDVLYGLGPSSLAVYFLQIPVSGVRFASPFLRPLDLVCFCIRVSYYEPTILSFPFFDLV